MDFHIFIDDSVLGGIEDGDAGLVVFSQDDLINELHAPAGSHSSSFQAKTAAIKEAIQWLSSIPSWVSAIVMRDCKSLVQVVSNANSVNLSLILLQTAAAVLSMSKPILILWAPGHCGLPSNKPADVQAKLGAAETQPDNTLDAAT